MFLLKQIDYSRSPYWLPESLGGRRRQIYWQLIELLVNAFMSRKLGRLKFTTGKCHVSAWLKIQWWFKARNIYALEDTEQRRISLTQTFFTIIITMKLFKVLCSAVRHKTLNIFFAEFYILIMVGKPFLFIVGRQWKPWARLSSSRKFMMPSDI